MPRRFVLDSFALMAFFRNEAGGERVAKLLRDAEHGRLELYISTANLGEVIYLHEQRHSIGTAAEALARIRELDLHRVDADEALALEAAHLKAATGAGYADCFAAALARRLGATVVTGDPDFRRLEGVVTIDWLPQ